VEKARGHSFFFSINVRLMTEGMVRSRCLLLELLSSYRVPASRMFQAVLNVNGECGVSLKCSRLLDS